MTPDENVSAAAAGAKMSDLDRLNLKRMIAEGNVEDNTNHIRGLKHSNPIAEDILKIKVIQRDHADVVSADQLRDMCIEKCPFLYNNYTDIFNRVVRGELDLNIFSRFLYTLKQVEEEKLNYHEASFTIGKLLKEMYVDSAMRRAGSSQDAASETAQEEPQYVTPKNISWREYKNGARGSDA